MFTTENFLSALRENKDSIEHDVKYMQQLIDVGETEFAKKDYKDRDEDWLTEETINQFATWDELDIEEKQNQIHISISLFIDRVTDDEQTQKFQHLMIATFDLWEVVQEVYNDQEIYYKFYGLLRQLKLTYPQYFNAQADALSVSFSNHKKEKKRGPQPTVDDRQFSNLKRARLIKALIHVGVFPPFRKTEAANFFSDVTGTSTTVRNHMEGTEILSQAEKQQIIDKLHEAAAYVKSNF